MPMSKARLINLPQFLDPRGNLAVVEECREIPFRIKRCHWIYDVPGGGAREGHAYRRNRELIVALSGAFDVEIKDGSEVEVFTLRRACQGLYVPAATWRELTNFSTNAVAVILSSESYDEADYIVDFNSYLQFLMSDDAYEGR